MILHRMLKYSVLTALAVSFVGVSCSAWATDVIRLNPSVSAESSQSSDSSAVSKNTIADKDNAEGPSNPEIWLEKQSVPTKEWEAEEKAVEAFSNSIQSWHNKSVDASVYQSPNSMADIGKSFTASNLPTLSTDEEFRVDGIGLGEIFIPSKYDVARVETNDTFTSYTLKNMTVTVYAGVHESRLIDHQLRGEGAVYFYEPGTITNIHMTGGTEKTNREMGIGNTRGELIFSYGSPNAIWRDIKAGNYVYLYAGYDHKVWSSKQENKTSIKNTEYNSQSQQARQETKRYIAFTIGDNKISAIDFIDGPVWTRYALPAVEMHDYVPGQFTEADFVLRGLRLNEHFNNDADSDWKSQGTLYGSDFIGYADYGVGFDKKHLINRVFLSAYAPTRRGIAVGDTRYLLLFIYGMPTHVEEKQTTEGKLKVYEYKNPLVSNSYLLFTLDAKDQFIKSIMLSDRPTKQLK